MVPEAMVLMHANQKLRCERLPLKILFATANNHRKLFCHTYFL